MTTPLSEQTPAEIDGQLFELYAEAARIQGRIAAYYRAAESASSYSESRSAEFVAMAQELEPQVAKLREDARPLEEQYQLREWTRAYLVTNTNGHVHVTQYCATCFDTTDFFWLTEVSGKDEAEIVDLAGERACTVCYPSAPVDVLKKATRLFSDEEKAAQERRDERAAKRAKAEAEVVHDAKTGKPLFKSVRATTNAIAERLSSLGWYGETHPSADEWKRDIEQYREALAAKGAEYDYDKALTAMRKRIVREIKGAPNAAEYPKF